MNQKKWPRPPLILGFVLGGIIERYLFASVERYGIEWLSRPVVVVVLTMSVRGLIRFLLQHVRGQSGVRAMLKNFAAPRFRQRACSATSSSA